MNPVPPGRLFLIGSVFLACLGAAVAAGTGSIVAGMAASAIAFSAWHWPEWTLIGLMTIAPLGRSFDSVRLPAYLIAEYKIVIALLIVGVWALRWMLQREKHRLPPWLMTFLSVWLALTLLTTLHAVQPPAALQYAAASCAGAGLFCATLHSDKYWRRRMLACVLLMSVPIACIGVLQYLMYTYHILPSLQKFIMGPRLQQFEHVQYAYALSPEHRFIQRSSATMGHPNQFGLYLALVIPFFCAFLAVKNLSLRIRFALIGLLLVLLAGLYTTNARSAIAAVGAALGFLALHKGHRWLAGLAGVMAVTALLYYSASTNKEAIHDQAFRLARVEYGLSGREGIWKNALDLIRQNPYLGVGPGNFCGQYIAHFGLYTPSNIESAWEQIDTLQTMGESIVLTTHAHNTYLQLAAELGLLGPFLYLCGFVLVVRHCERRAGLLAAGSFSRTLAIATASSAVGVMIFGLFDSQIMFTALSLNFVAAPLLAIGLGA